MLSKTIVKYIQSLAHKKVRDGDGVFMAEGTKVVKELLISGRFNCNMICALPGWFNLHVNILKNFSKEDLLEITEFELQKISLLQTPNNVVAVFYKKDEEEIILKNNISLMLDGLQDPGNMGTIIRTADWFGIKNIICSKDCVDCYNPKVVQATMGSLARVNIIYTQLEDLLEKNKDVKMYATALTGENIFTKQIKEGIILVGNEGKGVSEKLLSLADFQISIPKIGEAESLNAAVATGIILAQITSLN